MVIIIIVIIIIYCIVVAQSSELVMIKAKMCDKVLSFVNTKERVSYTNFYLPFS